MPVKCPVGLLEWLALLRVDMCFWIARQGKDFGVTSELIKFMFYIGLCMNIDIVCICVGTIVSSCTLVKVSLVRVCLKQAFPKRAVSVHFLRAKRSNKETMVLFKCACLTQRCLKSIHSIANSFVYKTFTSKLLSRRC